MSATYDPEERTPLNKARELLGDTAVDPEANALHSDEHIELVLVEAGSFEAGVQYLANELITRFAQEPDSVRLPSGMTVSFKERINAWKNLVQTLQAKIDAAARAAQVQIAATSYSVDTEVVW